MQSNPNPLNTLDQVFEVYIDDDTNDVIIKFRGFPSPAIAQLFLMEFLEANEMMDFGDYSKRVH